MALEMGSLDVGLFLCSLGLEPWLFPEPGLFAQLDLIDGTLLIGGHQNGRLEVALRTLEEGKARFLDGVISPVIEAREHNLVVLTATWRERRIETVRINGIEIFPSCEVDTIILKDRPDFTPSAELAAHNYLAQRDRIAKLQKISLRPDRKEVGSEYLLDSLLGEIEQIEDLLTAVKQGRDAHVAGLAARLRLLTVGRPFGLLQHCAALQDFPLILYTCKNPESEPPFADGVSFLGSASGEPSAFYCNPIDLDVWLSYPAFKMGSRKYSHLELIKDFGDTIGAHRDPGLTKPVDAYRSLRSQRAERYGDLQKYVVEVSEAILVIARDTLRAAGIPEKS